MTPAQINAFQANAGFTPGAVSTALVGAVLAIVLVWGVWAMRTAYSGWSESQLSKRQFVGVAIRFVAIYAVLTYFLLS